MNANLKASASMIRFKKIVKKVAIVILIIIPVSALAHFLIFPEQSRSILVDYSNLKKQGNIYYTKATPQNKVDSVQILTAAASTRVAAFWGQKTCSPTFIYCDTKEDFKKFGSPYRIPALTHIKLGTYIVISNEGVDLDIIAHEISHAEFYQRIGFYNWSFKIPCWFDEGLAMQNDFRNYYSEDTLKVKSNNFTNLPDVTKFTTGKQFNEEGSHEQIMLNYMTAKHIVKNWYTKEKLDRLIKDINAGVSFETAFGK
jgi:hypothetical protein